MIPRQLQLQIMASWPTYSYNYYTGIFISSVGVVRPVNISSFFYMTSLTTYHASFSFTVTCGIRAACNEYFVASVEEERRIVVRYV